MLGSTFRWDTGCALKLCGTAGWAPLLSGVVGWALWLNAAVGWPCGLVVLWAGLQAFPGLLFRLPSYAGQGLCSRVGQGCRVGSVPKWGCRIGILSIGVLWPGFLAGQDLRLCSLVCFAVYFLPCLSGV